MCLLQSVTQKNEEIRMTNIINPANIITLARIGIILTIVAIIIWGPQKISLIAAMLCAIVFIMDRADGFVANRLSCKTEFGGVLDVVGDRIAENVFWILFAHNGLVPVWIPVIVIVRGFIVDGFRSYALSKGFTTFAMMNSGFGRQLVASPISRLLYGIMKMALFIGGFVLYGIGINTQPQWLVVLNWAAVIVVAFCVIRGYYSIKDTLPLFMDDEEPVPIKV